MSTYLDAADALTGSIEGVSAALRQLGFEPSAVVVNVVYSDKTHLWAVSSVVPTVSGETQDLLVKSLRESACEVEGSIDA